jgi:hypothetical protein
MGHGVTFEPDMDRIVLASGRRFFAAQGILGLSLFTADHGLLKQGADGGVWLDPEVHPRDCGLTPAERHEVADAMIARWTAWREAP